MPFANFGDQILHYVIVFAENTWWFFLFLILFPLARSAWFAWRHAFFLKKSKWTYLEMKIPREILRSPRGMDQVFQSVHTLRNTPSDFQEKWWDGEHPRPFTFEMVSFGGEVHFYVRCYYRIRALLEGAFYSAYPDVELLEVDDYMNRLPKTPTDAKALGYKIWGTEMVLKKPSMYPIKTYLEYEAPDEAQQFDPISVALETLAKVKKDEFLGIQINAVPGDTEEWREEAMEDLEKLREPKILKSKDPTAFPLMVPKSPGQTDVIKAIEANLAKPVFDCKIRAFYMSPAAEFYDSFARRGFLGMFNQYAHSDMNSFGQNITMASATRMWYFPYILPSVRTKMREQRIMQNYRTRSGYIHTFIGKLISSHFFNWNFYSKGAQLNTEALATIFHPPMQMVLTGPHTPRVESRKMGAPAGLPIYGDEGDIKEFQ